jgi:hypothetical protein
MTIRVYQAAEVLRIPKGDLFEALHRAGVPAATFSSKVTLTDLRKTLTASAIGAS